MMYDMGGFYAANPHLAPRPRLGSLSRLVERLVRDTDMGYEEVCARVREQFPDAKTTARSVASVACVMRSRGIAVPMRAKVKQRQLALI